MASFQLKLRESLRRLLANASHQHLEPFDNLMVELDHRFAAAITLKVNAFADVLDEREVFGPAFVEQPDDDGLLSVTHGVHAGGLGKRLVVLRATLGANPRVGLVCEKRLTPLVDDAPLFFHQR
jgi:hypothetical protein